MTGKVVLSVTRLGVRAPVQREDGRRARAQTKNMENEYFHGKDQSNLYAARAFHHLNCMLLGECSDALSRFLVEKLITDFRTNKFHTPNIVVRKFRTAWVVARWSLTKL